MKAFLLVVAFLESILGAEEHAYQQFIECSNSEGQVPLWNYGYDGKDIMHMDLVNEAVVATSKPGQRLAEERKSREYIKRKEDKLKMVCSAVKTVFLMSNNSLSKAEKKEFTEHVPLAVTCFLLGFALFTCIPLLIRCIWQHTRKPPIDERNDTSADSETSINLMNVSQET
ncbi:uncharacterized protein [Paramisgurnus dabryanus]|uniref:uncharacterized protein isoform X2 n=1 Tax=Paramisgurnus dabryanus TaxID=90735 RepID=UPI0031F4278D